MSASKKDPVSLSPKAEFLKLEIRGSAFGGEGVATHEGKVCFVEGALPGEEVEAELLQDKKEFLRLRVVNVLRASPHRVTPPCSYYGRCGGCQYQHASYEEELRMKGSQFADVMKKIGGITAQILSIVHGEKDYHYRASASFHVGVARKGAPALCYIQKDNVTPLAVKSCDLLEEPLAVVFDGPPRVSRGSERIAFRLDEKGQVVSDQDERFFRIRLAGRSVIVNSKGFFQNNLAVTEMLCAKVSEWLAQSPPKVFYDLYAGVGTFSLLCAENVPKVVLVEESSFAIAALRMNREERKFAHWQIEEGRVERLFSEVWVEETASESTVFLDPPRQGMEKGLADFLADSCRAQSLIYVSCDPGTMARDLKILLAGGHWKLEELVPFDMFPRTQHLEAAAFLRSAGMVD